MRFMTIYKPGFEDRCPADRKGNGRHGRTHRRDDAEGFAIIDVPSKAEAIEWTKRFLSVVGHGESEIRVMHDIPAAAGQA